MSRTSVNNDVTMGSSGNKSDTRNGLNNAKAGPNKSAALILSIKGYINTAVNSRRNNFRLKNFSCTVTL